MRKKDSREKYAEAALESEAKKLGNSSSGDRNNQMNRSAFSMGQLVGAGILGEDEVFSRLSDAAICAGIAPQEAKYHLRKSISDGMNCPREIESQNRPTARNDPPQAEKKYPPSIEVRSLWEASRKLCESSPDGTPRSVLEKCSSYCALRGISPKDLSALDIARSFPDPKKHKYPTWWPSQRAAMWNLVTPAYNYAGVMTSIHARAISSNVKPKVLWPKGYMAKELIMVSPRGLAFLRKIPMMKLDYILIVEGIIDLFSSSVWACRRQCTHGESIGVIGIVAGSAPALGKVSWGDTKIVVASDEDNAGEKYFSKIIDIIGTSNIFRMKRKNRNRK